MIAENEPLVKASLADHEEQEALLIGEEWHLDTCPCEPCAVENDRQAAFSEAYANTPGSLLRPGHNTRPSAPPLAVAGRGARMLQ